MTWVPEPGDDSIATRPPKSSARLTVDSVARWAVGTQTYAGTRLDQITALSYSADRTSRSSPLAVSVQFDIDYGLGLTTYQGRLVFEPYLSGSPPLRSFA
jgi:hypothetical protein